jgi:hypothetical protein
MRFRLSVLVLAGFLAASPAAAAVKALFDNFHTETAGNADWQIDTHQPTPSPSQSGIGPGTPGTYWVGAISSWGVALVKRGYTVATNTTALTYQNPGNPLDLANYDVLIVDEPNTLFSSSESAAILSFVHDGGGLVAISDHSGSDRNNDGYDSPMIWNAMDPTHLLGVHCGASTDANNNIVQTSTNVNAVLSDSVTRGPVGSVTGLAFHNGTTFTLYPSVNATVRGEVWMSGIAQTSLTGLMAASSRYGSGRACFVGDSSPADDGTAAPGNSSIYNGWGEAGATDSTLFLNATLWATRRSPLIDATAPTVSVTTPNGGESWIVGTPHGVTWTATDNVGVTAVDIDYSADGGASWISVATGEANDGIYGWMVPNSPTTQALVRVKARDAAGNVGSDAGNTVFTIRVFMITASAGIHGSIAPGGTIPVARGAVQAFTVTPDPCYQVADVLVDGSSIGAAAGYTFSNVQADHTIAASFSVAPITLSTSVAGGGSLTIAPLQPSYVCGDSVRLTAWPDSGWSFDHWTGGASGSTNPVTLVMTGNEMLAGVFVDVASPAVTVTSPNGGETWQGGSTQSITWTATDNAGVAAIDLACSTDGGMTFADVIAAGLPNSGSYSWAVPGTETNLARVRITAYDAAGNARVDLSDANFEIQDPLSRVAEVLLGAGETAGVYPNPAPAAGKVHVLYRMPHAAAVDVSIFDIAGHLVRHLASGSVLAGVHDLKWDTRDAGGRPVPAGIYMVRITGAGKPTTKRLVMIR